MTERLSEAEHYRRRAEAEINLAKAAGATRAEATPDYKTVFIQRRDGTEEKVHIPAPQQH